MKRGLSIIVISILVICIFASCAATSSIEKSVSENAKNMNPPEGKALVYIYRTSIMGFAVGLNVSLNDNLLASFYPKNFYLCTLNPGKYVFTGKGENQDDLILKLEANKKYYIEANPKMGNFSARIELDLHDQIDGNESVQKCKMIGSSEPIQQNPIQPASTENTQSIKSDIVKLNNTPKVNLYNNNTKSRNSEYLVIGPNFGQYVTSVSSGGSNVSVRSDRLTSFHIGYTDLIKFNDKWAMKTGILLSVDGGTYSNQKIAMGYACVPIQAQYFINNTFSAVGGFNFDFGLYSVSNGDVSFSDDSFDRFFNPSLSFGVEAKLNKTFKVYANYNAGLNNIIASDYSSSSYSITKNVIQVGVGILLK